MPDSQRLLNLRSDDEPALAVTSATASAEAQGWHIEAQRRAHAAEQVFCVRVTAPGGQRLDLAFDGDRMDTDAQSPVSRLLSPEVGRLFRKRRSRDQVRVGVRALEAVFTVGWDAAGNGAAGPAVLTMVQAAANEVSIETVEAYRAYLVAHQADGGTIPPIPVREIARLVRHGVSPEDALAWFGADLRGFIGAGEHSRQMPPSEWDLARIAEFARRGWSPADLASLETVQGPRTEVGWARFSPERGLLVAEAGLSLTEFDRHEQAGDLTDEILRTLAGLRRVNARIH